MIENEYPSGCEFCGYVPSSVGDLCQHLEGDCHAFHSLLRHELDMRRHLLAVGFWEEVLREWL